MIHRELATTPLLVVANKIDLEPHASEQVLIKGNTLLKLIQFNWLIFYLISCLRSCANTHTLSLSSNISSFLELNLDYIVDNPWIVIPCSALKTINVDEIVSWLIKQADK